VPLADAKAHDGRQYPINSSEMKFPKLFVSLIPEKTFIEDFFSIYWGMQ